MPSARAESSRYTCISTFSFVLLVLSLLALTGCKKDHKQTEAGDGSSPASVVSAPMEVAEIEPPEITPQEELATLPSAETKGLSVHTIPAESPIVAMPEMKAVAGMDMAIRLSPRMTKTPGWTQRFPEFYKPVNDCLMQVDGGGAYVAAVKEDAASQLLVSIVGLDNHWYECRIGMAGGKPVSLRETEESVADNAAFYPRTAGSPRTNNPQCYALESVVARPGGLIGWLAFRIPDCVIGNSVTAP